MILPSRRVGNFMQFYCLLSDISDIYLFGDKVQVVEQLTLQPGTVNRSYLVPGAT